MSKMYILIKESTPKGMVPLATAHASLACYLKFKHEPEMKHWLENSFKKVVCSATDVEIGKAKVLCNKHIVMRESTMNNEETCVVFMPRQKFPKMFKYFQLYK